MTRTVLALLSVALAAPAAAKDIRVMADGSGDYRTFAKGLEMAESGDVIVMKGSFGMVGAILKEDAGRMLIDGTVPGSPAEAAGLKKGDRLEAVDGVGVSSKTLAETVNLVRGPSGTSVALTLDGGREVKITRGHMRMVVGDDMSKASIAYEGKDFETAALYGRKAAEAGSAAGQYYLALAYTRGEGVKKDGRAAFGWAAKAASAGHADAQRLVSEMYRQGAGIHRDEHLAEYWREKADEKRGAK